MFDISWSEFLLIGVVALVVIGPKELPVVMRTLGQWTRKVRGMASEFQSQFQEAMREAEMTDLKKEVDDLARDVKSFDPLKDVRTVGEDVKRSLTATSEPALTEASPDAPLAITETANIPVSEGSASEPPVPEPPATGDEPHDVKTAEVSPPADLADKAEAGETGRTG